MLRQPHEVLVLMYADPAATEAMTAAERAEVFRRQEALHQDLEDTCEMLNGAGPAFPRDTKTIRWQGEGTAATTTDGPLTDHMTAQRLSRPAPVVCTVAGHLPARDNAADGTGPA